MLGNSHPMFFREKERESVLRTLQRIPVIWLKFCSFEGKRMPDPLRETFERGMRHYKEPYSTKQSVGMLMATRTRRENLEGTKTLSTADST